MKAPIKLCLSTVIMLGLHATVVSQNKDTINYIQSHSPAKAVKYSILCPGLGQIYNKKFWKIPVIYGAGTTMAYGIVYNQVKFRKLREAVFNSDSKTDKVYIDGSYYDKNIVFSVMRFYERNRDKCLFGLGAVYLLNVIDAMVDAYFFNFDISDDLSVRLKPALQEGPCQSLGFGINFEF